MEIEVKIDELRKKKIFVATPMYGGMCHGMYTKSTADLATIATQYGMDVRFFYLFNAFFKCEISIDEINVNIYTIGNS